MNTNHETHIKLIGLLAWSLSVCGLAIGIWFVTVKASTPAVALDSRGCVIGRPTPAHLVILLDASDRLTPKQIQYVDDGVRTAMGALPSGALVELYRLENVDLRSWTPFAAVCLPNNGKTADGLTQNPRLMIKRFQERLSQVLAIGTEQIERGASDTSPILEAVHELAVRFDVSDSDRQLLVASDLLEHSGYMNQYRHNQSFQQSATTLPPVLLAPTLRGTTVEVLYLYRPLGRGKILQPPSHKRWWLDYLGALGATVDWHDETTYGRIHDAVVAPKMRQRI